METTMLFVALREFTTGLLNQLLVNLSGQDGQIWLEEFRKFLRKEPCWVEKIAKKAQEAKVYFRQLFIGENISIGAVTGTETFKSADFVLGYIHPDYKRVEGPRPEIGSIVHELVENGTFSDFFGSVNQKRSRWTESQVVRFCYDHRDKLRTGGYATFFELEGGFVAYVLLRSGGHLDVGVYRFSDDRVWSAEYRRRLVLPQQILES